MTNTKNKHTDVLPSHERMADKLDKLEALCLELMERKRLADEKRQEEDN